MKTYYDILEVSKTAGSDEIKSAYRSLAAKYHPDVNSSPDAADYFKLVGRAYTTLNDPDKRKLYNDLILGGGIFRQKNDAEVIETGGLFPAISNSIANILTWAGLFLAASAFVQWGINIKTIFWSSESIISLSLGILFGAVIGFNSNFEAREIFGKFYSWYRVLFWLLLMALLIATVYINYSLFAKTI